MLKNDNLQKFNDMTDKSDTGKLKWAFLLPRNEKTTKKQATTLPVPSTAALRTSLISESNRFSSSGVDGRGQPTQSSST